MENKSYFIRCYVIPVTEIILVTAFFLGFAFYGRHNLISGNQRHNLIKLFFYACVFAGAFIINARLYSLLWRKHSNGENRLCFKTYTGKLAYKIGWAILLPSVVSLLVAFIFR